MELSTSWMSKDRGRKSGLPPGSMVHVGERRTQSVQISLFHYDEANVLEKEVQSVEECFPHLGQGGVTWINIAGVHDPSIVQALGEHVGLHPLVMEDIVNTEQRPKMEDYGQYIYVVIKMLQWQSQKSGQALEIEQVSLIIGSDFVLSFQERPGDLFDPIRDRLRSGKGRVRKAGADYLAYCLLDAVVDGYFVVLEQLGDRIDDLEEDLVNSPGREQLRTLHRLKRHGLFLRRSVWPLREVLSGLQRSDSALVQSEVKIYLRDVYDHTIQVIDTLEAFRDILAGMLDTYLSSLSNRMNEIMKVLTIIATIFIPLTFLAGIWGMNFEHMPELSYPWAYPAALGLMAAVALALVIFFRRKGWL